MVAKSEFTATQQRMLAVLADGRPHTRQELHACLSDEMQPIYNIRPHISGIRKVLRPKGHDIVCEIYNRIVHYRHVILLPSACE